LAKLTNNWRCVFADVATFQIAACKLSESRVVAAHPDIVKARSGWSQTVPARHRFCI